jgi:vancomycin aglycone glucosyltransferase
VRVVLSTWGSRGDVEPLAGLAVGLRELGAEVRVCAPPDEEFAALLARVGVPLVPLGPTVRSVVAGTKPPTAQDAFRLAPELVAARFDTLTAAAEGCDALLATGLMPAGARDVAEKLGIRYVYACFHIFGLPSRHFSPGARPGKPSPQEETDNRVLWEQDAQRVNALYGEALNSHRAAIGLPPVDNVRDYVFTDQPWLAADATLCPSQGMTDLDIVQTGAWILPDDRPLPQELEAFLDASAPPVYVGLGSMAAHALKDIARVAIEASRAHGRRDSSPAAGPTWSRSTTSTTASSSARSTSRHCSAGWPPWCTTAARAPRRRRPGPARPRWWSPRSRTSRTGPPEWPSWASARLTTARLRPSTPCPPRSERP